MIMNSETLLNHILEHRQDTYIVIGSHSEKEQFFRELLSIKEVRIISTELFPNKSIVELAKFSHSDSCYIQFWNDFPINVSQAVRLETKRLLRNIVVICFGNDEKLNDEELNDEELSVKKSAKKNDGFFSFFKKSNFNIEQPEYLLEYFKVKRVPIIVLKE